MHKPSTWYISTSFIAFFIADVAIIIVNIINLHPHTMGHNYSHHHQGIVVILITIILIISTPPTPPSTYLSPLHRHGNLLHHTILHVGPASPPPLPAPSKPASPSPPPPPPPPPPPFSKSRRCEIRQDACQVDVLHRRMFNRVFENDFVTFVGSDFDVPLDQVVLGLRDAFDRLID